MKNGTKRLISLIVCLMLLVSMSAPVFAKNINSLFNSKGFKDVKPGHWAYEDIMWMLEKKIIDGKSKDIFEPNGTVTRAEFAKMMVNTLQLKQYKPDTPSFLDVKKTAWEYPFVEAAKAYLTGFRTASGDYFKPKQAAVREDMAVALVKALGYQNDTVNESILNTFADAAQISPNLKKYVALSVKHGLIQGYTKDGRTVFDPQGNLTRAQSATLLRKAFVQNEEKVTYNEDKVTYDDNNSGSSNTYTKPVVSISTENNIPVLRWNKITSDKFREYRVVISKGDNTPEYPANGYLYSITDRDRTYALINNSQKYNQGDFGSYLTKGETYYISVTAVYTDRTVAGNTVRLKYNGAENPELSVIPIVTAAEENGKLVLRWNSIDSSEFVAYRVVASRNDDTPSYPDNGYLYTITDRNKNYAVIDNLTAYSNGDFGGYFIKGEQYYFSITAEYKDRKVPGNVVKARYNGQDSEVLFPAPRVSAVYENGKLVVKWNKSDSSLLTEYRVVISEKDQNPEYPANGYYEKAFDADTTSVEIDTERPYSNGDFSKLTYGTEYYISVTAVYGSKYVPGNAVKILYLIDE
ncbi:MAG: S-layer homology domain-containing protein [Clostridiaceae bacterium]|nr:S-layer homology domain-containing protein [Clostridiaceae bacterium]